MLPLGKCYTYANWKDAGGITVIVSRIHPKGTVTCADFCIDKLCRGVRGTRYFFNISPENLEEIVEYYSDAENDRMVEIPYEVAHNLIYGSIEFAGSHHRSLADYRSRGVASGLGEHNQVWLGQIPAFDSDRGTVCCHTSYHHPSSRGG